MCLGPLSCLGWEVTGAALGSAQTPRGCVPPTLSEARAPRGGGGVHRLKREKESASFLFFGTEGGGWLEVSVLTLERPPGLAWFGQMRDLRALLASSPPTCGWGLLLLNSLLWLVPPPPVR